MSFISFYTTERKKMYESRLNSASNLSKSFSYAFINKIFALREYMYIEKL